MAASHRSLQLAAAAAAVAVWAACGGEDPPDGETGPVGHAGGGPTTLGAPGNPDDASSAASDGSVAASDGAAGTPDAAPPPPLCVGAADDPAAAAVVGGFVDKVGNPPSAPLRAQAVDAILRSCSVFGPPPASTPGWTREDCWAHLASAIDVESSYNPTVAVTDAYATRGLGGGAKAADPTVGLLQVRFSSTVHDFATRGRLDSLACAGCTFPAAFTAHLAESGDSTFWAVSGPAAHRAVMNDPSCNIALGAWYYYVYATGNGAAQTTQLDAYCAGQGTSANLVTGLLSHYLGPDGGRGVVTSMGSLSGAPYDYVVSIKSLFDTMIPAAGGTHPFFVKLAPRPSQYCR
jgi:hypothetical protein